MSHAGSRLDVVSPPGDLTERLRTYVYARNAHRSARKDAVGYTHGQRIYALREAAKAERTALDALAGWVEDQARRALDLPQTPVV